ncbi:MAG: VOC family protein [Marinomonas sp.]|uniref:VOC family protein n=1 Tax=Parasphingorhabdus sp. TaxID=2709688 RepID=UPI00327BBB80
MKRFHMNLRVEDMAASTHFYTQLFGAKPTVDKADYKKWMLDDPFVNISIEPSVGEAGIAHVGLQAENSEELVQLYSRIKAADAPEFREGETQCCYAHSYKSWTQDPDGVVWETFFTDGERRDYGEMPEIAGSSGLSANA